MAISKAKLLRPSARCRTEYMLAAASQVYNFGDFVALGLGTGSANTIAVVSSSTKPVIGRIMKAIATTDSDYAVAKMVPIEIDEDGIYEVAATNTALAADPGNYFDFSNGETVDHNATTNKNFLCTKFISATKIHGQLAHPRGDSNVV